MNNNNTAATSASKHKRNKKKGRVIISILLILAILILVCCLGVVGYVLSVSTELPDITADDLVQAQTSFVYDSMGQQIAELHGAERRTTVELDQMPKYLLDMVVASEDMRFYKHHGVDFRGTIRAIFIDAIDSIKSGEVSFSQGASTITMQLVRNVIDDREMAIKRKVKEALLAMEFEKHYDKDEILYYYVNEIYLGPEIYGMQAAAEYYFDKDVSDVTMAEAATLVGLIRNPGYYSPYNHPDRAVTIRNTVLNLLVDYDSSYAEAAVAAKADDLVVFEGSDDDSGYDYPWYVDCVISEAGDILEGLGRSESDVYTGGLRIYTAMDVNVQKILEAEFADSDNFPDSYTNDIVESSMVIMEPATGEVKGLMGGREYVARRGFNRAVDMLRSPGSTIKPVVVYGPAVDLGYSSGTVIDDSPAGFNSSYSPKNDDWSYSGRITMREAIVGSRNVCAVKMLQTIGEKVGWDYGVKMGLPLDETDVSSAMALGGLTYGVSPMNMVGAFSTFANAGIFIEPHTIRTITDAKGNVIYTADPEMTQVMSEGAAYILTDMLTSAVRRGTGTSAGISGWQVAGKTGTNGLPSEDPDYNGRSGNKDAWFVGYTTALSASVWMGYDNKRDEEGNLQYLSFYGGGYPARLFRTVMSQALENYPNNDFVRPDSVINCTVDTKVGGSPTSLTPGAYMSSELCLRDHPPASDGSVSWVSQTVCAESKQIATEFCPETTSGVFLKVNENGSFSPSAADAGLYMRGGKTCELHASADSVVSAYVCTDPRHNGEVVLCSSGCPTEYRQLRNFSKNSMPTTYCTLEDHQGSTDDDEGGGNGQPETPGTPYDIYGSNAGGAISVVWQDDNPSGTVAYVVERTVDGGNRTKMVTYSKSYYDADVESGHTYAYRVYAYNESTQVTSGWSSQVSVSY